MQDYEEYGSSFRQPRALRDDGGPANNSFQQYDGNQVNTEGRPPQQPVSPDDEEARKKKAASGAPSVGAQVAQAPQPQTFAQMQAQGIARPPAPAIDMQVSQPMGYDVNGNPNPSLSGTRGDYGSGGLGAGYNQPNQALVDALQRGEGTTASTTTSMVPGPGGGPPVLRAEGNGSMEDTLKGAWEGYAPQTFGTGKDTEMQQKIRDALMQSIGNPSRYDTDVAKRSFDMLSANIDDDYNARDQSLRESVASRGLGAIGDGTIGTSDQRFQNLQRRSAKADMANTILREQANTYGADRSSALRDAMGYGNDQFGNDLAEADFNARRKQEAYNNYTGYGQQAFENQTTAAEMKNRQQQQNYEMLMKLLGIS
jgi:hypothetical protein